MKVKQTVLKEDVSITFTPEEIWELILICEGDMSYCKDAMNSYPKGSKGYNEYMRLKEIPEQMQMQNISQVFYLLILHHAHLLKLQFLL